VAAQMLAMVDAAGRLPVTDAAIAAAMGCEETLVAGVRARMQRLDPVGMFAANLRDCLAAQLADRNRLDPCMEALLDNLEMLARRDMRGLMATCAVDAEDLEEMVAGDKGLMEVLQVDRLEVLILGEEVVDQYHMVLLLDKVDQELLF
jgi:RNA polymerase sigma-54 factor